MKKFLIILICTATAGVFAGIDTERGSFERSRFEALYRTMASRPYRAANIRSKNPAAKRILPPPTFKLSRETAESNAMLALIAKYPKAYYSLDMIEEFSYFGFRYAEVRAGKRSFAHFLREYETYLSFYN